MAIDTLSKVLVEFRGDVSDLKSKIKDLAGEEKKLAQAQLEAAEARNKGLDSWVEGLGHANQALELVGKAVEFGKDAFKEYADGLRLRAAAGAADIDRLKEASLGLRSEDELLAFAAKAQHGAYKLTQEQMELAQRAMVGLTRAGFEQKDVVDKVTDALVTGKARGLHEFGISVEETGDKTRDLNAIMAQLAQRASGVQEGSRTASEEVQAMGVSMGDSVDNMKEAIGKLVVAMGPLLSALAKAVQIIAEVVDAALDTPDLGGAIALWRKQNGLPAVGEAPKRTPIRAMDYWNEQPTYDNGSSIDQGRLATTFEKYLPNKGKSGGSDTAGPSFTMLNIGRDVQGTTDDLVAAFEDAFQASVKKAGQMSLEGDLLQNQGQLDAAQFGSSLVDFKAQAEEFQKQAELAQRGREKSYLEATFGSLESFSAYSEAFGTLTTAVTSSMDAFIDGSVGSGKAFGSYTEVVKKAIGEQLKALSSQMGVEALKHGAYALGSLAFGDFAGAGAHALAAAEFAAVAVAAGVGAREFGHGGKDYGKGGAKATGGAGASGGSAGSSAGGGAGGNAGGGNVTYVIPYGDAFFDLPETAKRRKAQEIVSRATPQAHGYSNS